MSENQIQEITESLEELFTLAVGSEGFNSLTLRERADLAYDYRTLMSYLRKKESEVKPEEVS